MRAHLPLTYAQFDREGVERAGLVKFDLLSSGALASSTRAADPEADSTPLDGDERTADLVSRGPPSASASWRAR